MNPSFCSTIRKSLHIRILSWTYNALEVDQMIDWVTSSIVILRKVGLLILLAMN